MRTYINSYINTNTLLTLSLQWMLTPFPKSSLSLATLPFLAADNSWISYTAEITNNNASNLILYVCVCEIAIFEF